MVMILQIYIIVLLLQELWKTNKNGTQYTLKLQKFNTSSETTYNSIEQIDKYFHGGFYLKELVLKSLKFRR